MMGGGGYLSPYDIEQAMYESVDPESWDGYEDEEGIALGEGTITLLGYSFFVKQTPENHQLIARVIEQIRTKSNFDKQVAIEARFLTVSEQFIEDIGLDLDFTWDAGGKFGLIEFNQDHSSSTIAGAIASTLAGNYGSILDDLQVNWLLRATQSRRDAKILNAPKATVRSGETAMINLNKDRSYIASWEFEDITSAGIDQPTKTLAIPIIDMIPDGVNLMVTPAITSDNKYVLLSITTWLTQSEFVSSPIPSPTGEKYPMELPLSEIASLQTLVNVPDGGTLVIGGQKIGNETDVEAGVPVLNKLPYISRLFSNRSKKEDHSVLLILVRPTIMLRDETEAEHLAALEESY